MVKFILIVNRDSGFRLVKAFIIDLDYGEREIILISAFALLLTQPSGT